MKVILFIILFWISTVGYCFYLKYKFNIKSELLLAFVFSFITFAVFILGLLNILSLGSYLILLIGIGLFIYYIRKYRKELFLSFKHPNINLIIIFILMLYITVVFSKFHLLHYDNFTHWGLIVKNMILYNKFPNFENAIIEFKGYQPGTACFIYYIAHLFKFNEGIVIVAQNYLFTSFLVTILTFTNGKYKNLFRFLCVILITFCSIANILPYDLLVDSILSAMFIFAFVIIYEYRQCLNKMFYGLLTISMFLCLVKNTGYVLTFILCLIYLIISIKNNEIKKGFKGSIIIGLSSLILLYIWTSHVKYSYGYSALYSHHSLTYNNIYNHLLELGKDGIFKFLKIYFNEFFNLKTNICAAMMLSINFIVFSFLIFYKDKRKLILQSIFIIDLIYIIYYIALGFMYICSMDISGIFELVAYQRYLLTITISLIVISVMVFMYLSKNYNFKFITYGYTFLIIFLLGLYIVKYDNKDFRYPSTVKLFVGKSWYETSYFKKYDEILANDYINMDNDETYYVYNPTEKTKYGYLTYLSKYKLNHNNIVACFDTNCFSNYTDKSIIITFQEDFDFKKKMKEINFCKMRTGIYEKCTD